MENNKNRESAFRAASSALISLQMPQGPIRLIHMKPIHSFSDKWEQDPYDFIENYERMLFTDNDNVKVNTFIQYLEGGALDWLVALQGRNDKIQVEDILLTWDDMSWENLKNLFLSEFGKCKAHGLIHATQRSDELGSSFYYRMSKLHQRANWKLNETDFAEFIVSKLNASYKETLTIRNFKSLSKLKKHLKRLDDANDRVAKLRNRKSMSSCQEFEGNKLSNIITRVALRTPTKRLPFCEVKINGEIRLALIDPGCAVSIYGANDGFYFKSSGIRDYHITDGNGANLKISGEIQMQLQIGDLTKTRWNLVSLNVPPGMFILGNDILVEFNFGLNYEKRILDLHDMGSVPFHYRKPSKSNFDTYIKLCRTHSTRSQKIEKYDEEFVEMKPL